MDQVAATAGTAKKARKVNKRWETVRVHVAPPIDGKQRRRRGPVQFVGNHPTQDEGWGVVAELAGEDGDWCVYRKPGQLDRLFAYKVVAKYAAPTKANYWFYYVPHEKKTVFIKDLKRMAQERPGLNQRLIDFLHST